MQSVQNSNNIYFNNIPEHKYKVASNCKKKRPIWGRGRAHIDKDRLRAVLLFSSDHVSKSAGKIMQI